MQSPARQAGNGGGPSSLNFGGLQPSALDRDEHSGATQRDHPGNHPQLRDGNAGRKFDAEVSALFSDRGWHEGAA